MCSHRRINGSTDRCRITFKIKPTVTERFNILDFGVFMVAHGLRRGVFGEKSLGDLLELDVQEFGCEKEFEDLPVFFARTSRSGISSTKPATVDQVTKMFQASLRSFGIAVGKCSYPALATACRLLTSRTAGEDTLYMLRRNFATANVEQGVDRTHAKFLLGHNANSYALERFYDQSVRNLDVSGTVLGAEEGGTLVARPLSAVR